MVFAFVHSQKKWRQRRFASTLAPRLLKLLEGEFSADLQLTR
jgi:hypothetical protein